MCKSSSQTSRNLLFLVGSFFWITWFFFPYIEQPAGGKNPPESYQRDVLQDSGFPLSPPGSQDRNGRSRLLFLQLELRRLKLACGTMNFNNNNNVSRWSGGTCGGLIFKERYYESFEELLFVDGLALGGLLAFLGLFFFLFETFVHWF